MSKPIKLPSYKIDTTKEPYYNEDGIVCWDIIPIDEPDEHISDTADRHLADLTKLFNETDNEVYSLFVLLEGVQGLLNIDSTTDKTAHMLSMAQDCANELNKHLQKMGAILEQLQGGE